jgi:hypothetical protein
MNGADIKKIDGEIAAVVKGLQTSWADFAIYCKGKIFECGINNGISSYTINGRSVTKDLAWWQSTLELANRMAAVDASGGIAEVPISFRSRR